MQHSIEQFTRECLEMESEESDSSEPASANSGMHRVYENAAKSVQDALKVDGAVIFDLSHFELIDSQSPEGEPAGSKIFFPSPYQYPDVTPFASFDNPGAIESVSSPVTSPSDESLKGKSAPPMAVLGASESLPAPKQRHDAVPLAHHVKVAEFLRVHRDGHHYPFTPAPFRHLIPTGVSNVLLVPIFGLNKQPFALLCAYSRSKEVGPTLEELKDSGLQYLRAIGMIILSAVLKKDIMLADKAKSHFISK